MATLTTVLIFVIGLLPQSGYKLTRVEITGAHRLSPQQIVAMSGLKTGATVNVKEISDASQRLLDSGLFTSVNYHSRNFDQNVDVIFEIEEAKWDGRVFFDNFPGQPDAQLSASVAKVIPTFDGFVPQNDAALNLVARALERVAHDAGQPGKVNYVLVDDQKVLHVKRYRFHLDRDSGPQPICTIEIGGVPDDLRALMASSASAILRRDYSRDFVERFSAGTLPTVAFNAGYLRARFLSVTAVPQTPDTGTCTNGAGVTIAFEPGLQYAWHQPIFEGVSALNPADLEHLLPFAPGSPADLSRIEAGARQIAVVYQRNGYLMAAVALRPAFADTERQVTYTFRVAEGKQFHMGDLQIVGLDEALAASVRSLWQMKEGAVFDASYPSRFTGEVRTRLRAQLAQFKVVAASIRPNDITLAADVTLTFKLSQ